MEILWWSMDVCPARSGIKAGHRDKTKAFSLCPIVCRSHSGCTESCQTDSHCVPKCVHVTRIWHNRPTSFVSWAYSDTVHHDLSLDNLCWYCKLSFVAWLFLKGTLSFQRALWHRLTLCECVTLCAFIERCLNVRTSAEWPVIVVIGHLAP